MTWPTLTESVWDAKYRDMLTHLILWLILGLVAGSLAKLIMPGKDPGGLMVTIGLGVAGSFVGGYLGRILHLSSRTGGFTLAGVATAVGGAVVILALYRLVVKR